MLKRLPMTNKATNSFALRKHRWLGWLLAFLIMAVIAGQTTHNTGSDPRGTLLVSQAIAQHGSVKLDAYGETRLNSYGYVIHQKGGHFYNYFPLGTALVSTPFVAALGHKRNLAYAAVAVSGLFAIYINTYQALFNPYGMQWNVEPNVDQYPEYLFDWRYPQFLHSKSRHEERLTEFRSHQLPSFTGLIDISYDSAQAAFGSFYGLEAGFRWSEGQDASLSLMLGEQNLSGEANLQAGFLGNQALTIELNGQQVYEGHFDGGEREIRFSFAPKLLHAGLNTFTFHLPDAHRPASEDPRILAMAFRRLSLK